LRCSRDVAQRRHTGAAQAPHAEGVWTVQIHETSDIEITTHPALGNPRGDVVACCATSVRRLCGSARADPGRIPDDGRVWIASRDMLARSGSRASVERSCEKITGLG